MTESVVFTVNSIVAQCHEDSICAIFDSCIEAQEGVAPEIKAMMGFNPLNLEHEGWGRWVAIPYASHFPRMSNHPLC